MSIFANGYSGAWARRNEAVPMRGEVERHGVILTASGGVDTPEDREARIVALEAKHAAGVRLFEPGFVPPVQPDRYRIAREDLL